MKFVWSDTIKFESLVKRNDLYYKLLNDVPFNGQVKGLRNGEIRNGMREGLWESYFDSGQLKSKGTYKNGKQEGLWTYWYQEGSLDTDLSGIYKDGEKIAPLPDK